jgi:predicted nucleic acid-binding Zn ribbon protein
MSQNTPAPELPSAAVQTAVVRSCDMCGGPILGARTVTCSDRCRAVSWRRRQDRARRARDGRLLALARELVVLLEAR